jgi:hypothetical protein
MWSERDTSIEYLSSSSSSRSSQAPLYPQRVSPVVLNPRKSSNYWTTPVYLNLAAETQFSLDKNSLCSSSDSEVENEVIDAT